jgi:hypothetical protein
MCNILLPHSSHPLYISRPDSHRYLFGIIMELLKTSNFIVSTENPEVKRENSSD